MVVGVKVAVEEGEESAEFWIMFAIRANGACELNIQYGKHKIMSQRRVFTCVHLEAQN